MATLGLIHRPTFALFLLADQDLDELSIGLFGTPHKSGQTEFTVRKVLRGGIVCVPIGKGYENTVRGVAMIDATTGFDSATLTSPHIVKTQRCP